MQFFLKKTSNTRAFVRMLTNLLHGLVVYAKLQKKILEKQQVFARMLKIQFHCLVANVK
jgi:hypothetical protein